MDKTTLLCEIMWMGGEQMRDKVIDVFFASTNESEELVQVLNRQLDIIEIEAKAKKEIQNDLNLMRINTSTVYPGLERRAMMNRGRIAEWKSFK